MSEKMRRITWEAIYVHLPGTSKCFPSIVVTNCPSTTHLEGQKFSEQRHFPLSQMLGIRNPYIRIYKQMNAHREMGSICALTMSDTWWSARLQLSSSSPQTHRGSCARSRSENLPRDHQAPYLPRQRMKKPSGYAEA